VALRLKKMPLQHTESVIYRPLRRFPTSRWPALALFFALFWTGSPAWGALGPAQVLILVNLDEPVSSGVAKMYQELRAIPEANLLRLPLGSSRQIAPEQYWRLAGQPIKKYLEDHPEIRCVLTTAGVPYTIMAPGGGDEGAAFDNELAMVLREEPGSQKRHQPNPLYLFGSNPAGITDPRLLNMIYVARLDGPDLATITRMVKDAIAAESHGLEGPVAGDARGLDAVDGYGEGDASIRGAVDRFGGAGFQTTLDMKEETWKQPQGGVGNQAAGAAFYMGWYALLDFQDIFGDHGLAQGSIAWHIASQEAQDIWDPAGKGWCINLMRRGAAVTIGPVREPYVTAFPHGNVFVEGLLQGLTVADSYWISLPHVSWAMVLLGDPLYRPFGVKPKPALLARAYEAGDASRILEHGKTSSLLVQLDCIGPAGSSTPAYAATAAPEMGLAAASGTVSIPALKAGESVVVRVPSVTAGDDPSGMFRLRLEARADGQPTRTIVVEGRIGFSRLTGGLGPKSQMFVSPDGKELISGRPGRSAFIDIVALQEQAVNMPQGYGLTNAEFSPDGKHVAVTLIDPKKKQAAFLVSDDRLRNAHGLPAGLQFLRWLDNDRVLMGNRGGLISHSITGGDDRALGLPEGRVGNFIPGTDIQFAITEDARVLIKNGAEPFREVLKGSKPVRFVAVANDLSLFGGVDGEKRLWVQKGLDGQPKAIAEGVDQVLWGPISHRAVVQDATGRSRLYDGRDGTWKDLGFILESAWSPDEERLLFVAAGNSTEPGYLSLLTGTSIERLCPMSRIGQVGKIVFSADQTKAYLLATLAGQPDVWMIPVHARTTGK
jgi:uncharacterized protein (TIGR03790 family)